MHRFWFTFFPPFGVESHNLFLSKLFQKNLILDNKVFLYFLFEEIQETLDIYIFKRSPNQDLIMINYPFLFPNQIVWFHHAITLQSEQQRHVSLFLIMRDIFRLFPRLCSGFYYKRALLSWNITKQNKNKTITEIYCHFFSKHFVKSTKEVTKQLISRNIFGESKFLVFPHCTVLWLPKNTWNQLLHWEIISRKFL